MPTRGHILAQHVLETLAISPFLSQTSISKKLLEKNQSSRNRFLTKSLILLKKLNCIQNYKTIHSSIGHKCLNQNYTNNYFLNPILIKKFDKHIEKIDKLKTKSTIIPFECAKCKKQLPYKKDQKYKISIFDYMIITPLGILVILSIPKISLNQINKFYYKDKILNILDILERSGKKSLVKKFIKNLIEKSECINDLEKTSESLLKKLKLEILELKINKTRNKRLYKLQAEIYNNLIQERVFSAKHKNNF